MAFLGNTRVRHATPCNCDVQALVLSFNDDKLVAVYVDACVESWGLVSRSTSAYYDSIECLLGLLLRFFLSKGCFPDCNWREALCNAHAREKFLSVMGDAEKGEAVYYQHDCARLSQFWTHLLEGSGFLAEMQWRVLPYARHIPDHFYRMWRIWIEELDSVTTSSLPLILLRRFPYALGSGAFGAAAWVINLNRATQVQALKRGCPELFQGDFLQELIGYTTLRYSTAICAHIMKNDSFSMFYYKVPVHMKSGIETCKEDAFEAAAILWELFEYVHDSPQALAAFCKNPHSKALYERRHRLKWLAVCSLDMEIDGDSDSTVFLNSIVTNPIFRRRAVPKEEFEAPACKKRACVSSLSVSSRLAADVASFL